MYCHAKSCSPKSCLAWALIKYKPYSVGGLGSSTANMVGEDHMWRGTIHSVIVLVDSICGIIYACTVYVTVLTYTYTHI